MRSVPSQVSSGPGWHYQGGAIVVDADGTVIEGLDISGSVTIRASNVIVRNNRIRDSGQSWGVGLASGSNVTIAHNVITSPSATDSERLQVAIKNVYGRVKGILIQGNDISRTSTGVQIGTGVVRDNWIHDLAATGGDHVNGVTSNGSDGNLLISHNTILNQIDQTDAIALFPDFAPQRDVTIENNLLAGGGYTIYGGYDLGKGNGATANIVIRDNRISRIFYPNGGSYGWLAHTNSSDPGNQIVGNVWDDSGAAIKGQ